MTDSDHTLSSPLAHNPANARPMLCLTIVWHPDSARIGEQVIATADSLELARFEPQFRRPQTAGLGLAHGGVSREPVRIARGAQDQISITPPASRMVVEVNGDEIHAPHSLSREQIDAGAILGLGRSVLICLHWMNCLPTDNPIDGMTGVGGASVHIRDLIRQVAHTEATVLLLGETGTGKEVAARAIHALGKRAGKALVSVNMAALNADLAAAELFGAAKGAYTGAQNSRGGLFAEAQDATLFLATARDRQRRRESRDAQAAGRQRVATQKAGRVERA